MELLDIRTHPEQLFYAKDFNKQKGYSFIIDFEDTKDQHCYVETGVYLHWMDNNIFGIAVDIPCMFGCNLSCSFCSSSGYYCGELSSDQMIAQVELSLNYIKACEREFYSNCKLITFSFAGTGEPSKCGNQGDVIVEAIKQLKEKYKRSFPTIQFMISTIAADAKAIELWANCEEVKLRSLQISLHAPTDDKRRELIGSKNIDSINDILKALETFCEKSPETRIKINYLLIAGKNDNNEDLCSLINLIQDSPYWLKLSFLNNTNAKLKSPTPKAFKAFLDNCSEKHKNTYQFGVSCSTTCMNIGCGQLAAYANMSYKRIINNEHIKDIYERIIEEDVILFLGAGVNSNFKTGRQLANDLFDNLFINEQSSSEEYSDIRDKLEVVADFYSVQMGRIKMRDYIRNALKSTKYPEEFLELTKYLWRTIYTVNYDSFVENAYEKAFETKSTNFKCGRILDHKDLVDKISKNTIPLIKLHGSDTQDFKENVISSIDYLNNYESKRQYFFKMLEADFIRYTFVFAGYSFNDHYLSQLLYNVYQANSSTGKKSYAILNWDDTKGYYKEILKQKYGVSLINCTFEDFLYELARLRKLLRVFVSGSAEPKSREDCGDVIERFCEALGDKFKKDGIHLISGASSTKKVGYLVAKRMEEEKVKTYGWHGAENVEKNEIDKMIRYECCGWQSIDVIDKSIRECNVAVFIGGAGVCLEEIMQAMSYGKFIIPIKLGIRNYASDVIYEYIKGNIDVLESFERDVNEIPKNRTYRYFNQYLKHDIDNLVLRRDNVEEVAEAVMDILRRFRADS